jgi:hypothetical protein
MGYVNVGEFVIRNEGAATHTEQDLFSIFNSIIVINNNVFLYGQPLAELNKKTLLSQNGSGCHAKMFY